MITPLAESSDAAVLAGLAVQSSLETVVATLWPVVSAAGIEVTALEDKA